MVKTAAAASVKQQSTPDRVDHLRALIATAAERMEDAKRLLTQTGVDAYIYAVLPLEWFIEHSVTPSGCSDDGKQVVLSITQLDAAAKELWR